MIKLTITRNFDNGLFCEKKCESGLSDSVFQDTLIQLGYDPSDFSYSETDISSQEQADAAALAQEAALRNAIKTRAANYKTQLQNADIDAITNIAGTKAMLNQLRGLLVNLVDDLDKALQRML